MNTTEEPLGRRFSGIARSYVEVLSERLVKLDIERYYYPLVLISENQEKPLSQQQLSVLLNVDKVTTLRIVNYLAAKGYLTRKKYSSDKRAYLLMVTEKAKREIPLIQGAMRELNSEVLKGLSAKEVSAFLSVLEQVENNLAEMPSVKVRLDYKRVNRPNKE